jgi:PAS domain S-box-containing protein
MSGKTGAGRTPGGTTNAKTGPRAGPSNDARRTQRQAPVAALANLFGESPFEWATALYRSVVDTSPDAIAVTTVEGRVILCNHQAVVLHGFQKVDEMVGRSAWEFVAPEDLKRASSDLERTIAEGSIRDVEYDLVRADGGRVPVSLHASAVLDAQGTPRAVIGIVRDISERRRSEEALQRSEEYFRLLIENAPDLITVMDPTGKIRYQSPSIEPMLGYHPEELVGTNVWHIIHPEDAQAVGEAIARGALEPSQFPLVVLRARHKDGSWRFLEGTGKAVLDGAGRPYGVINSRDITDRVLAEQALEESERRKAAILETALDAIITINHKSEVIEFNPAAESMFGYTASEAMGKPLEKLIVPPPQRSRHRKGMTHYLATGEGPMLGKRTEVTAVRADGSEFPVEIAIVPIQIDGRPVFTGHVRDLTERRRWEEELQQAREELESKVEGRMDSGSTYGLSFRELTVLHLVASGIADKEIAVTLGISAQTVNKHVAKILHKMGASSRTEAGVRAIKDRIVE